MTDEPVDVVFTFTFETWNDAAYRGMNRPPDRLLQTLLAEPAIGRVLVANPYRSAPIRAARTLAGHGDRPFPATEHASLVTPLRLARSEPTDVPRLRALYGRWERAVERAARRRGLRDPIVLTANPFVAGFCRLDWAREVVFYARDDWSELPARRPWWPAIRAAYRELQAAERRVVAVSQEILDRIQPTGASRVVPNGVDPGEWNGPQPQEPAWMADIPQPRAIYVGTLDSRLDSEGVRELARRRRDLSIVLLGATGEPEALTPFAGEPNVHVHGHVGRAELVAAVRSSQMCLVAHRRTPLTEAMSPLKVFEYLAAGKPTISIDLEPVRGLGPRLLLAPAVEDFAPLIDEALAMGQQDEQGRMEFVGEHSWASRHQQILSLALSEDAHAGLR